MNVTHLNAGLGEANAHCDLLAHKDVRVVCLAEAALQLVQLRRREACAVSLLLVFVEVLQREKEKEREREQKRENDMT